jgi:hypothetical protein
MASKKNLVWDPDKFDSLPQDSHEIDPALFDSWDEEKEEAAIAEAAEAMDVKYIIIEGRTFAGRFPDGTVVKAPLTVTLDQIDAISQVSDAEVDQIKELFKMIGDEDAVAVFERQNIASTIIYAVKFFDALKRITNRALGKFGLAN